LETNRTPIPGKKTSTNWEGHTGKMGGEEGITTENGTNRGEENLTTGVFWSQIPETPIGYLIFQVGEGKKAEREGGGKTPGESFGQATKVFDL